MDSALFCKFIEFGQQSHWIWSANSMNLLGYFNDFALLSRWYSCAKELLHVSNESCSSQQNNLFCRANQFTLQRKSICFTEQIKLICNRICRIFARNICFSTYYTDTINTVSNSPQTRRQSWLFCGQTSGNICHWSEIPTPGTINHAKSLWSKLLIIYNFVLHQLSVGEKFRNFAYYITMWLIAMWHR